MPMADWSAPEAGNPMQVPPIRLQSTLRAPRLSTRRPPKGARNAITKRAEAAVPEVKLRDQPSSCSHKGMMRLNAALLE